ncbi:hypothetical protein PFZ55_39890 [Streptomyces sp. MS2A]|nr:hypothetical protein [Streptomyces sp. MS2A]
MAKVTITGNAWDANCTPIPAPNEPELWFRPVGSIIAAGLISDREVPAKTFTVGTGAFTVDLESTPGLLYVPVLTWLKNPADPTNRARGQVEWPMFHPGQGGPIDQLPGAVPALSGVWFGFGDPPEVLWVRNDVVWVDISGLPNGKPVLWFDQTHLVGGA